MPVRLERNEDLAVLVLPGKVGAHRLQNADGLVGRPASLEEHVEQVERAASVCWQDLKAMIFVTGSDDAREFHPRNTDLIPLRIRTRVL
jgi:hypothetical protein